MKYKHIFFDLDRTLWDFETNSQQTLEEACQYFELCDKGIPSVDAFIEKYKKINERLWDAYREGRIDKEALRVRRFQKTLEKFGVFDEALADDIGSYYIDHSPRKTALLPYTHEVLQYLKKKYHLHIITNGFEEVQHLKLERAALKEYFITVVTSEKAGAKKPHYTTFHYALTQTSAKKEESIMIGDCLNADVGGARNAGLDQVYYNPDKREHQEKVTYEIHCLSELQHIL